MINIVKDRPIQNSTARMRWTDFPMKDMEVGDSFFLKHAEIDRRKFSVMLNSVSKRLIKQGRGDNVKFSTRTEGEGFWVQRVS